MAYTKEAYIGNTVKIAIRVSKDTDKEWSAKCYLYIKSGFGALLLKKGTRRDSADEAMDDGVRLLNDISKEIRDLGKSLRKEIADSREDDTDEAVRIPAEDTE